MKKKKKRINTYIKFYEYSIFLWNFPISTDAWYINGKLNTFLRYNIAPNEWYVLDYPAEDVIHRIYKSNFKQQNEPSFWEDPWYHITRFF